MRLGSAPSLPARDMGFLGWEGQLIPTLASTWAGGTPGQTPCPPLDGITEVWGVLPSMHTCLALCGELSVNQPCVSRSR